MSKEPKPMEKGELKMNPMKDRVEKEKEILIKVGFTRLQASTLALIRQCPMEALDYLEQVVDSKINEMKEKQDETD